MRPVSEYIEDNFNGKLGLADSYKAYAKDGLVLIAKTFSIVNDLAFCKECHEFDEVDLSDISWDELIEHAQLHQPGETIGRRIF